MASKISVLIDVATDKAVSGLKGFKQSINDADGAVGKMKAGATAAFDTIKAHAGTMALAAGAALVTFGAKGVTAFNELALEASKFRDVSGTTLDEASRWIAVGDDIGLSGDTIASAFNKANIAIGSGKPLLAEYGIEVKRTKEGLVDTNATMLNAIQTIKGISDPTKKAELAAATFGKGWTEMSELIEMGSADITTAMGEVSDAQLIDEGKVAKAKEFRASMDKLGDSIKDLAMEFGEELTPAITTAVEVLATVAPVAGDMAGKVGDAFVEMVDGAYDLGKAYVDLVDLLPFIDMPGPIQETLYEQAKLARGTADLVAEYSKGAPTMAEFEERLREQGITEHAVNLAMIAYRKTLDDAAIAMESHHIPTLEDYIRMQEEGTGAAEDAAVATDELTDAELRLIRTTDELTGQYSELKDELHAEEDFLAAEQMWADLQQSAVDSYTAASTGAEDAAQKAADHQQAVIDAKLEVLDLAEKYRDLPAEKITNIIALIDQGKLAEAEAAFNNLTRNRTMNIDIVARGGAGYGVGQFAEGGTVPGPIGSPQLAIVHGGEEVIPVGGSANGNGYGGAPISITVNAGMGADGREIGDIIVSKIREYERRNGNGWRG